MNKKTAGGNTTVRLLAPANHGLAALIGPWVDRASCTETAPETFFRPHGHQATKARQVCARCPVRDDCLAYALDANEQYGIWGLDPGERRSPGRTLGSHKRGTPANIRGAA